MKCTLSLLYAALIASVAAQQGFHIVQASCTDQETEEPDCDGCSGGAGRTFEPFDEARLMPANQFGCNYLLGNGAEVNQVTNWNDADFVSVNNFCGFKLNFFDRGNNDWEVFQDGNPTSFGYCTVPSDGNDFPCDLNSGAITDKCNYHRIAVCDFPVCGP